jgi:hypothetical protein
MKKFFAQLAIVALIVAQVNESATRADVLFESGTLGPTGIAWSDLTSGVVPGSHVSANVFTGVVFQLVQPARVTQIGGHFGAPSVGSFFGAIVTLDGPNDFPNSENLSTPDVVAETTLTFPIASAEVYGNLDERLGPGWYALIFGSGLFGATGAGAAVQNNPDIGSPNYIGSQPGSGWFSLTDLSPTFANHRFVVLGTSVAEPSTIALLCLGALMLLVARRR